MFKSLKKNFLSITFFVLTTGCLVAFSLFSISFSSIFYILIGGTVSLIIYLCGYFKNNKKQKNTDKGDM
jgi:hypothetical protein